MLEKARIRRHKGAYENKNKARGKKYKEKEKYLESPLTTNSSKQTNKQKKDFTGILENTEKKIMKLAERQSSRKNPKTFHAYNNP